MRKRLAVSTAPTQTHSRPAGAAVPRTTEQMLDYMADIKQAEKQNVFDPTTGQTRQAEAIYLIYMLRKKKIGFDPSEPMPSYTKIMTANVDFLPTAGHDCSQNPKACAILNLKPNQRFVCPKDEKTYQALGSIYVCSLTGFIHRCDGTVCGFQRPNPTAPGTKSCPVSGLDKGSTIDDSHEFARISHERMTDMDNDAMESMANGIRKTRAVSDARIVAAMKPLPTNPTAATVVERKRRIPNSRDRKRNTTSDIRLITTESRTFQRETMRNMMLKNQTPGHQEDVKRLTNIILGGDGLRTRMKRAMMEMEEAAEQELTDMIEARSRKSPATTVARGGLLSSSSPGRSAANVAAFASVARTPPRPIDVVTCAAIINRHMIRGSLSVLRVCLQEFRTPPTEAEIGYFEKCMLMLFTNVSRVSIIEQDAGNVAQKNPNLGKISLALFYMLRDGLIGYRRVNRESGKYSEQRVCTSGDDYAFRAADAANIHNVQIRRPADDDRPFDDYFAEHDNSAPIVREADSSMFDRQRYVLVPAHPGLKWFLPDHYALSSSKLTIDKLPRESASLMRKLRSVRNYFIRMLDQPSPEEYCLGYMISPLRTDLFVLDQNAPIFPSTNEPTETAPAWPDRR